jgi:sulfate permease, SulP family
MSQSEKKVSSPPSKRPQPGLGSALVRKAFPFLSWFKGYKGAYFRTDFLSGLTVALVLIPQSMAYAQLAGLPPYLGLYAAFLPPMVAALFGSSYQLSTGPVAVVSLMTAAALEPLATAGSDSFVAYAVLLSLIVGGFQFLLGFLRLGLVVNFLSHPVVNGFTNAAALIIATSQLSKLFGVTVDNGEHHYETVYQVILAAIDYTHWPTLGLAVLSLVLMIGLRRINRRIPGVLVAVVITTLISWGTGYERTGKASLTDLHAPRVAEMISDYNRTQKTIETLSERKVGLSDQLRQTAEQTGKHSTATENAQHELNMVELELSELKEKLAAHRNELRSIQLVATTVGQGHLAYYQRGQGPSPQGNDARIWRLKVSAKPFDPEAIPLMGGGAVVGSIPRGLPKLQSPLHNLKLSMIPSLLSVAIIISLLGFMEAISIAKAMAAKTGQRLDPNQELMGQGLANIVGSFFRSYPVSGSFSRSAVNLQAGAITGMSSVFSSGVVLLALLFFTPLLYHLPQSVLASIIMMAVIGLVNVRGFMHAWQAQKYDGAISIITFVMTLFFAPELDIGIGIGVVLSLALYLLRNMKPLIASLAKHPDGSFRSTERWDLTQCKHVAVIRFTSALFFVNVNYLEEKILEVISSNPELRHILLVGNGINELDASGEDMLSLLVVRVREAGYDISISGLNDAVLDVMKRTRLYEKIGEDHFFRSVAGALEHIHAPAHRGSTEAPCPLLEAPLRGLPVAASVKRRADIAGGPLSPPAEAEQGKSSEDHPTEASSHR